MPRRLRSRRAFTLVELLVVIGIITVLVGILFPALNKARAQANLIKCESNLRQLGTGFLLYANDYRGFLPWSGNSDGYSANRPLAPWDDSAFWPNAVMKEIGKSTYYQLQAAAGCTFPSTQSADAIIHGYPSLATWSSNNIMVCPSASPAASAQPLENNLDGTFEMWGNPPGVQPEYSSSFNRKYLDAGNNVCAHVYWCYVINSKIDNSLSAIPGALIDPYSSGSGFVRLSYIPHSSLTALLVEKRMAATEGTVTYTSNLAVGKTTYTVFASRHNNGGNILFADGHVAWFAYSQLNPLTAGYNLSEGNSASNIPNAVIWDPLQNPVY